MGKQWKQCQTLFWGGSKITSDGDCNHKIKRHLLLGRKVMTNLDSVFKSRDITLPTKVCLVKAMVFPVVMYGCESWTVKKAERRRSDASELWCWIDSWETLGLQGDPTGPFWRRSTLGFLWREWCWSWNSNTFWPPHAKSWLIGKDPDAGKDWGQEEKGTTEDEMAGWYHWLNGHKFEQSRKDGEGHGSLLQFRGYKESDKTERLNNNKIFVIHSVMCKSRARAK